MAATFEEDGIKKPKQYDSWFNPEQAKLDYQTNKRFEIKGFPYPLDRDSPRGFFWRATNHEAVKADLLQLLLTEPGERVMLPSFGTGLRSVMFEQKDNISTDELRILVSNAILNWEPRIAVREISVKFGDGDPLDTRVKVARDNVDSHSLIIRIVYSLKEDLEGIEKLEFRINYNEPVLN